jgi:uncharacterized protein
MLKRGSWMFILLLVLSSTLVLAQNGKQYHLKLLAVQEDGTHLSGSDADLYLELKEGSGRVFLETFPLTKIDTQISTRFAKDIACKNFKLDCNKHDFIFTIKAKSNIIGGPSAGAAIAALTTIAIKDLPYTEDIAITGTINSGGIIGHVGGVKQKIEAAKNANLKKVLIAKGNGFMGENETNVIDYARDNLSLEVVEVVELSEIIFHLSGIDLNHKEFNITEDKSYTQIMSGLQNILCQRSQEIETELFENEFKLENSTLESITMRKGHADNATRNNDFYSAASFCFGLNIQLKSLLLEHQNLNKGSITQSFNLLERKVNSLLEKVENENIETITDLQTLMVVKERLNDVKEQIKTFREGNQSNEELYPLLAYAQERLYSAISWMQFFSMTGKKFILNEERLRISCQLKISESEERHQYASLFITPSGVQEKIEIARKALENQEFALCLITASQAKAQANAILSSLGLVEKNFDEFLNAKEFVAARVIAENTAEGMFPILGYSYYKYANSLKEREKYSSLLYLEYALEMSDLSIYFPEEKAFLQKIPISFGINKEWLYLIVGFIVGSFLTFYLITMNPSWFNSKKKN